MKLLHIINTLETGGAQSVLVQLIKGWRDQNDEQMVISLSEHETLSRSEDSLDLHVEYLNLKPGEVELAQLVRLARIIRSYHPDLVQTWLYHADLIGGVVTRFVSRAPIIWGIHHTTTDSHSVKPATWKVVSILSRLSTLLPAQIICCSNSAYQAHVQLGYPKDKMITIVNGVDTDHFRPDPTARIRMLKELGLSSRAKLIGMFARFHPQKDHDTLFRAAGIFLKTNPHVHFVLAGEGIDDFNTQLYDKIRREGIQNNFHLLGNRQDMHQLNAGMDIVTLSSSYGEALPMTLCEAMSCARPCVASNVGDIAILIENSGIVVESKNPQALADAWQSILELSDMEYDQLCYQARQRILRFYNVENMINQYKNVYHALIGSGIS